MSRGGVRYAAAHKPEEISAVSPLDTTSADFAGAKGSPTGDKGWVLGGSRAPLIVFTSDSFHHRDTFRPTNHYSLLGAIQSLWGLGCLNETCSLGEKDSVLELFER